LHASLGEIVGGFDRVAVRTLVMVRPALLKSGEQEIQRTGNSRPIERARLRARQRHQLRQRPGIQGRWRR
jgi:hypothetical protein